MIEKYIPIACSFHDLLLDRATRQSIVLLEYFDDGQRKRKETIFTDVFTKKGEEFLALKEGETIRLDKIISVDGHQLSTAGTCGISE